MGVNMATKEYVLRIGFDPITEEVTYIKEYIDTLELEYNALSGNSCLEEYLNRQ